MWKFDILEELPEEFLLKYNTSNVFYHPTLIKIWLDTYKPLRKQIPIFIMGKSDTNEMFMPLALWKRNWKNAFIKTIVAVGNSDYDYHNPVFKNKLTWEDKNIFWKELMEFLQINFKFDDLRLTGIIDKYKSDDLNFDIWRKEDICPSLDLTKYSNEEDLFKFLKTSLRGDLKRQIRRLKEIGILSLCSYNKFEEIPEETFNRFIKFHSLKWPQSYKAPHLHKNLITEGVKSGLVDFSALKVSNKEIAWHLGFKDESTYYYYMPVGNPEFAKFSPVKVHLFYLVKKAIELNYNLFDHLRGDENYKSGWSDGFKYVNTLTFCNDNFLSKIKLSLVNLKNKFN